MTLTYTHRVGQSSQSELPTNEGRNDWEDMSDSSSEDLSTSLQLVKGIKIDLVVK